MYTLERWTGRVALITGASSGIGRAVAKKLAEAGMRIAICSRRKEQLDQLVNQLDIDQTSVLVLPVDLRFPKEIKEVFNQVNAIWGGVDVLVNNAGVGYKTPVYQGNLDLWREMVDVNILALCHCTYEAMTNMRKREDNGHIILISSLGAYRHKPGSIGNGMYVATKRAVRSLTESIRMELRSLGSNIRISAISPGLVETEFAERFLQNAEAASDLYQKTQTLNPSDIAEIVGFILSCPQHVQPHDVIVRPTRQLS